MPRISVHYWVLLHFLLKCGPAICAVRFIEPYFLIQAQADEEHSQNIVIRSTDCISGAFTNYDIKLTEFCLTGVWLLSESACADEDTERYIVSGRDSCFKIDPEFDFKAKRILPLMHNLSDLEGFAYAFPNNFAYFVRLNPKNKTSMKPASEPRKEWNILTINFGTYGRFLNEYTAIQGAKMGERVCYQTEPKYLTQVYTLEGEGDSIFLPYRETMACLPGFNKTKSNYSLTTGHIRSLKDESVINSTHSYRSLKYNEEDLHIPFPAMPVTGTCSDDKVDHPKLSLEIPYEKFPTFPHLQPPGFMDEIISDEIQNTAQNYMEYTLYKTPIPAVNRTEWKYIVASTVMLAKFCCTEKVKYEQILQLRRLFRLTYNYMSQYYPYEEPKIPAQDERILTALGACMNATLPADTFPCITVNITDTCPEQINSTTFNNTQYNDTDINDDIVFEVGNLDFVTELMWKAGLFVHYFCSPYFEIPTDHSVFYSRLESFFNPLILKKWIQPRGVHRIYELLLSSINFKGLAMTVDTCVATAKEISDYKRWLNRPGSYDFKDWVASSSKGRRKRSSPNTNQKSADNCVPAGAPKLMCVDKQFDIFDLNLIFPKPGAEAQSCLNVAQKKNTYKYIHANHFGTSY